MSEKRFEFYSDDVVIGVLDTVTGRTFNSFEIVDCLNEQQAIISALNEENERLQKNMENLQEVVAELGATLLMNGFEIEINGENLSELIDDE